MKLRRYKKLLKKKHINSYDFSLESVIARCKLEEISLIQFCKRRGIKGFALHEIEALGWEYKGRCDRY